MQQPGEYRAAFDMLLETDWAEHEGRCSSCHYAMGREGSTKIRCDLHDYSRMERTDSCVNYVPAQELQEARSMKTRVRRPEQG
jgi:hypothetical protein